MADLFQSTLLEASYEGVAFPCGETQTDGGHDSVEHVAYRRRGADIEPTGLKAYRGTMTVPLINGLTSWGDLFPGRYNDLLTKFESTPIGRLAHPSRGKINAHIIGWTEKLAPANRSGVILEVKWVQHAGDVSNIITSTSAVPKDTATAAQVQANATDVAIAASAPGVTFSPVAPVFTTQLAFLEAKTRTYAEITSSIGLMLSAVNLSLSNPALAVATAHPAVAALEALRAYAYQLRDRYLNTQNRPRLYTVPTQMAVFQIAQQVYGDASKATLITAVNSIPDPMYVPAGTVLTILPVS